MPSISWTTLTVDYSDPEELGAFYSQLLGRDITARDGVGWLQLRNPQAEMMHFEILVNDLDAAVQLVCDLGGNEAPVQPADRDRTRLRIMLDPAGHPFCLFVDGDELDGVSEWERIHLCELGFDRFAELAAPASRCLPGNRSSATRRSRSTTD